jgi:uncharacterized spore protein YtfJ
MEAMKDVLQLVGEHVAKVANSNVVVGSPVSLGTVTIVPVSRVSMAFGGGGGEGEGEIPDKKSCGSGKGSGNGSGGGARVRPVAIVAFTPSGVQVLGIPERKGKLDQLLEKIPALVERMQKSSS